ncbi:DUF935 domain-containing protein [Roseospirillum parvum]|uniref:Mu-like prophage protein gp29 n=1 Tax=Roseospirillum parvum TaxID=83401 RepID=A0A1G8GBD5_9PROT|nr:DUF935 domain-containing protein [Roseospirillum parvum]SDH91722.1 Mu-like prophage protein gp29 [Roseospirillum parvum]
MPLVDQFGNPVSTAALKDEEAVPGLTGVRQVIGEHPEAGLTPQRLAAILREAEEGDPIRQLELAEAVEEKYLHYQGVLGTRKRAVAQLPITVEAATDDQADVAAADLVRDFLNTKTLRLSLFDILDAVGKGYSVCEIIWETTERQWMPSAIKWRDPRWFELDQADGETLWLKGDDGHPQPLTPFKYIVHRAVAKSGRPVRGGIIRGVAWAYLFQNYGWKDWLAFLDRFGQPFRLGKYGAGATEAEKSKLLQAIRALSGDFGGIIPETMAIELIEAKATGNVTAFADLCNEADTRVSIAVLGQNLTTRVEGGSRAASETHNDVRGDIRDHDALQLEATLERDLVRPLVDLNRGPQRRYPHLRIGEPDPVDRQALREDLQVYVPMGMKVGMSTVRDIIGLPDPDPDEEVLTVAAAPTAAPEEAAATRSAAHGVEPSGDDVDDVDALVGQLEAAAGPAMDAMIDVIRQTIDDADSIPDAMARIERAYPDLALDDLADLIARAATVADLSGRAEVGHG